MSDNDAMSKSNHHLRPTILRGRDGHPPCLSRPSDHVTSSRTVTCVLFGLLALAAGSDRLGAQVRTIDVNGLYPAGTSLASPMTGIAFQLPAGFRAEWDPGLGALLALSGDGAFGLVWGWSEGSVEEAAGEVGSRLDQQGITLRVRTESQQSVTEMRAAFDANTTDGQGVLHALIRQGPLGGVVAIAGMGAEVNEGSAARFVDAVAASLEWTEPGASTWRQRALGTVFTWSATTISFCSPDQYVYRESSESSAALMGASASGTSSDEHTGGWWLISDLSGLPLLVLEATDGRTFQWSVQASGDGFLIDGHAYRATGQC